MSKDRRRSIELLSPARDLVCGMEAVRHGADAVYIGGPEFGARSAAGNSVEDIQHLCDFAHTFGVRVYVTLNTILYDEELENAERLIWQLYHIGVDALIVQDTALLAMNLPPIALHASTQMDNRTPQKAQWLQSAGFNQIVLARELHLDEIKRIADCVTVPLEAFVHGAVCVSYSGRCYASEYCFKRSANRGCCAQFCRLAMDLVDENGKVLWSGRHPLSLTDMNRMASLEEMMEAGISSFKIEGRLKSANYVKNVTAAYRRAIDEILARRSEEYIRASFGTSRPPFTPDVNRTFNRGFTDYFLHRLHTPGLPSLGPKALGPQVARVGRIKGKVIEVVYSPNIPYRISTGDGLCYTARNGEMKGFRVNKAEDTHIFPAVMPTDMSEGMVLYRSLDASFDRELTKAETHRTLSVRFTLRETTEGFVVDMEDETSCRVSKSFVHPHEPARTPQYENIRKQFSRLGDTPFELQELTIETEGDRFIPSSQLAEWRRQVCNLMLSAKRMRYTRERARKRNEEKMRSLLPDTSTYFANVSNHLARRFYTEQGAKVVVSAFEQEQPQEQAVIMTCRYCIRRKGHCLKGHPNDKTELFLRLPDGRTFPLRFDCHRCEMQVLTPKSPQVCAKR